MHDVNYCIFNIIALNAFTCVCVYSCMCSFRAYRAYSYTHSLSHTHTHRSTRSGPRPSRSRPSNPLALSGLSPAALFMSIASAANGNIVDSSPARSTSRRAYITAHTHTHACTYTHATFWAAHKHTIFDVLDSAHILSLSSNMELHMRGRMSYLTARNGGDVLGELLETRLDHSLCIAISLTLDKKPAIRWDQWLACHDHLRWARSCSLGVDHIPSWARRKGGL